MKAIRLRHILIASFAPLGIMSIAAWCVSMIRYREVNGIGLIVVIYYFIPTLVFAGLFAATINFFKQKRVWLLATTFIGQILVSLGVTVFMLTAWVFFEHRLLFNEMEFGHYWWLEFRHFWIGMLFFAFCAPLTLRLLAWRDDPGRHRDSELCDNGMLFAMP